MKVLLTGALGNVGEYALAALLAEGYEVVAFELASATTRRLAQKLDPRVHVCWGDITDPSSIGAALAGVQAVVHLAGIVPPVVARAPALARRVNVDGTASLLALMEASPTAKRLVFASSQGVFGEVQAREPPILDDAPTSPSDEYGRQKVECERMIRSSALHWTILRLAGAVPTRLLGSQHDPRVGFELSARARIEFIHPADAGVAFARAVSCEQAVGRTLNIGGGTSCQMIVHDFYSDLLGGLGIGPIPAEAFVHAEVPRCLSDWLDTTESQRLFRYQTRGLPELKRDLRAGLGLLAPVVGWLRPLVTYFYVRSSPYLKANRRRADLKPSLPGAPP